MDVLIVEDDPPTRALVSRIVAARGHDVTACSSGEEALDLLQSNFFPLLFLDINLPGLSGLDVSRHVRRMAGGDRCYILVGTGHAEAKELRGILDAGANDYISKPYQKDLLDVRLTVAEAQVRDIQSCKQLEAELRFMASHDPLTRLMNRSQLDRAINHARKAVAPGKPQTLMFVDLDNFKAVNDNIGHEAGDELLVAVADLLRTSVREGDVVIRHGGDEFVVILSSCSLGDAVNRGTQLLDCIQRLDFPWLKSSVQPAASIGICEIKPSKDVDSLMKEVDIACYQAKSRGRNRVELFTEELLELRPPVDASEEEERFLTTEGNTLELWFQPVCDAMTGQIRFHEALLRWIRDGETQILTAGMFIASLSRARGGLDVDRFVLRKACENIRRQPGLQLSINLHASSICDSSFAGFVEEILNATGIDGGSLVLEVTETEAITNLSQASSILRRLREMGCRTALDDFGAGFSSLNYLKHLPVDIVKIDGQFIQDLPHDPFNQSALRAILALTREIGLRTVAERVETMPELEMSRRLGVDYLQGYYVARPRREPFTDAEINFA